MKIKLLPQTFEVRKIDQFPLNLSSLRDSIFVFSRTQDEMTLICEIGKSSLAFGPSESPCWRGFYLVGPFGFNEAGILRRAITPLSSAKIGVLVASTFDSDLIFVQEQDLDSALREFKASGFEILGPLNPSK